jgi:hypothetical protein
MVKAIVLVCEALLAVPVTITFTVPNAAPLVAVNVSMLVLPVLDGLKDAVTPLGKPEADRLTLPENPPVGLIVTVLATLESCCVRGLFGAVVSENPLAMGTRIAGVPELPPPQDTRMSATESKSVQKIQPRRDSVLFLPGKT